MKKILVFIDWYKPGYKAGGPIRSMANMIGHLSDSYDFYVVTRNTDFLETKPYCDIEPDKWTKISKNEHVFYISEENLSIDKIKNIINTTPFDIAYINGVYSFYFSILPLFYLNRIKNCQFIVAPRGMLSIQTFKAKALKKRTGILIARIFGAYKKAIFHVTSTAEKIDIENLKINPKSIFLVSNLPPILEEQSSNTIEKKEGELRLVSIARISNEKNTLFALQCLQNFTYKGTIIFDIFGSIYQKEYWDKCLEVISKLPENIQVNYLKEINNNQVQRIFQNYHFLFMPSLGENFGHSILESFIAGCPVIISNKTPWHNLEEKGLGWDLDLNYPETFANCIQKSIDLNDNDYRKLSKNSQEFANRIVDNQEIKNEYYQLFG